MHRAMPTASEAAIPAELLLRRDRMLRFERGGIVYATDGRIGLLKQVVVDEIVGEVVELIIQRDRDDRLIGLPPEAVDKTAGSAVFLLTDGAGVEQRAVPQADHATRLTRVDAKVLRGNGSRFRTRAPNPRRHIGRAGKDFVEIPGVAGDRAGN
jgi:hypothetical protein